jgi:hypothetical protein
METDLAVEFRRSLQAEAHLIGRKVTSWWVKSAYPEFCRSLGVKRPPPYQDFARELAKLMPRTTIDTSRLGKRRVFTAYLVQDPNAAVVEFTERKSA